MALSAILAYKFVLREKATWKAAIIFGLLVFVALFVIYQLITVPAGIMGFIILFGVTALIVKYYCKHDNNVILRIATWTLIFNLLIGLIFGILSLAFLGVFFIQLGAP